MNKLTGKLTKENQQLFEYAAAGVSPYHVIAYTKDRLSGAGFTELAIGDPWSLEPGGRYFCAPFDTTLYAFTIGSAPNLSEGIHIAGAHTDYPVLKIKPNPDLARHGYLQINTEVYGGPILATWFDRPLSVAGKVVTRGERYDRPVPHLVDLKEPVVCLPNLAIHMNREANEKGIPIDNQKMLLPLIGMQKGSEGKAPDEGSYFIDQLAGKVGVDPQDILDYDLSIYNPQAPVLCGFDGSLIMSPRLDDLSSACALIHGLIESRHDSRINMVCLFDNEEIGSLSKQGADAAMPRTILEKIWHAFGKDSVTCLSDITGGMMLSADVAHAYHPNFPEKQDITNYPALGGGVCLKSAANQSYSWDAEMMGMLIDLCRREGIPYQRTVKHSGVKGGGTIGSIISSQLPMRTADLGIGLLAMHSSCETAGADDIKALTDLARAFFVC